tara:strand:- start:10 stop:183 length:174 start_codon:yes stop_codon:yes gene_type:complete
MNYEEMSLDDLEKELKTIEHQCKHWESCQDGSHGMALSEAGYSNVLNAIKEKKKLNG